jgi:putative ubiquitin-RnfH superfamily antitoxin RatB of RatAB toxin-antitoxin module
MPKLVTVQIIFANQQHFWRKTIQIAEHSSVREAIEASGVLKQFSEINLAVNKVGIFNELVSLNHEVLENDRIEIYRSLLNDPKELRKKRALEQKNKNKDR